MIVPVEAVADTFQRSSAPFKIPWFTTGLVRVLLVSVSVVARPTSVSVEVGNVIVPVFEILEITGLVNVKPDKVADHFTPFV